MTTLTVLAVAASAAINIILLFYIILKLENMKFDEFNEAINAKLDALGDAIQAETEQVTSAIQELRDLIGSGNGTPEQYLALLDRVDAKIAAVNAIYEPEDGGDEEE
jgi:ATP/maltotriose-dependent transcriptional regulator MalT